MRWKIYGWPLTSTWHKVPLKTWFWPSNNLSKPLSLLCFHLYCLVLQMVWVSPTFAAARLPLSVSASSSLLSTISSWLLESLTRLYWIYILGVDLQTHCVTLKRNLQRLWITKAFKRWLTSHQTVFQEKLTLLLPRPGSTCSMTKPLWRRYFSQNKLKSHCREVHLIILVQLFSLLVFSNFTHLSCQQLAE